MRNKIVLAVLVMLLIGLAILSTQYTYGDPELFVIWMIAFINGIGIGYTASEIGDEPKKKDSKK